jgi:alpha-mannosidase
MQKHHQLTLGRIKKHKQILKGLIYTDFRPVTLSSYAAPGRITYEEAMQGEFKPIDLNHNFSPLWSTHWVKVEYEVPAEWAGKEVHFLFDAMCEGEVWIDGKPMQGLTGSILGHEWDTTRPEYILGKKAQAGSGVLYVEVAVNHLFGVQGGGPEIDYIIGKLRQAHLGLFDREAWDLYWDYVIVADCAVEMPEATPRGGQAMHIANEMINVIRLDDRSTWGKARALAADFLGKKNGEGQHTVSAVGHAHIDTAWLWPLAETHRKCYRTFSSAVHYMDLYPDYIFTVSQAVQWEWMKEEHPDLYERMVEKAKKGQFVPVGGTWVEMDANIPSGESFVRQFLFGKRFFEKELGFECKIFWVPDVFGYSAALPQIMKQSGIDYFLTQKLSWNQFNKVQSHTFLWEGLDGSSILTHFPPADTYNSMANVKEVLYSVKNYKDHDNSNHSYLLYGYGDGGGGPTKGMIEQIARMKDVDGLPKVEFRAPKDFFKLLEDDIKDPVRWVGELYFELHRATYTTQALTKKNNRASEFLLHDVEFLGALANLKGAGYPKDEVDWMWKTVLTNQFHDIIPGSSITEVYDDAARDYSAVLEKGKELRDGAISDGFSPDAAGENLLVINTTSFEREEVAELPEGVPSVQTAACGKPLGIVSAPAYGTAVIKPSDQVAKRVKMTAGADGFEFENEYIVARLNKGGQLTSLFSKEAGREALAPGEVGNQFVMFEDQPTNWEAWDVDIFHLDTRQALPGAHSFEVIEEGPFRVAVAFDHKISETSSINQVVRLSATGKALEFMTKVEWHDEAQKFLKVEFPWDVRSSKATYEVQFGHLQRPTHFNTSWDFAQFEVCAHKWADLSEYGFGVSLLNDCKYGHSTHGNVMRISLVRAPKSPDPVADLGTHRFNYAVMPHKGSLQEAGLIREGYRFNQPLLLEKTTAATGKQSFFSVDSPQVVIDTVKKAEDSDEIIVRMYESFGAQANVSLKVGLPVSGAVEVNLLEQETGKVDVKDGAVALHFTPFQLRTLKIKVK